MAESIQKDYLKPKGMPRYSTFPPKDPVQENFSLPKTSASGHGIVIAIEGTGPSQYVLSAPSKAYISKSKALESIPKPTASTTAKRGDQRTASPIKRLPSLFPSQSHAVSPAEERPMMNTAMIHRPVPLVEESPTTLPHPSLHAALSPNDERPTTPTSVLPNCAVSLPGRRAITLLPPLKLVVPLVEEKSIISMRTSSPILFRSNSAPSPGLHSPISPVMHSIFPRYNPTLSLARQHYYPSNSNPRGSANETARPQASKWSTYTGNVDSRGETLAENIIGTVPRSSITASPSELGVPSRISGHTHTFSNSPVSTPEDLLDLWSIANGQGSQEAAATYTLGLSCPELSSGQEIITFTSSTSQILYRLEADGDDLAISRSHPINSTIIHISAPTYSPVTSNNPLIATIFPKLAELMALDQSSTIAVDHRLDRQASRELQNEALARAYQQEASSLFWDSDSSKFYLRHPTLSCDNTPATFRIEFTQLGIKIFAPEPPIQAPNPILTLSFEDLIITIDIRLLSQIPSLYMLDTLLATLLIILLHIHRTSTSASPLKVATLITSPSYPPPSYPPPPSLDPNSSPHFRLSDPPPPAGPWRLLTLIGFKKPKFRLFARKSDEARDEESVLEHSSLAHSASTKSPRRVKSGKYHLPGRPTPPKDTFEILEPPDEKLPRTTRAVLKLLYWAFAATIWAVGVGFRVLCAFVVSLGRCVAKL